MNEINPIVFELLRKRGISEESEVLEFLSEKPQKTYDPFLLLNMEAGVDFLLSAVREKKSICIYGDYDVDGITSVTLLKQVLSHLTDKLTFYIPSRFDEGYGLNQGAVEKIKAGGADLLVTVDCGSTAYEEVAYAKSIGLDIMVTDHHSITDRIADCILINPKQPGCTYPFPHLAGCGVAFKLAQALQKKSGLPKKVLTEVLDLVALGTIGDIVPLVDENRTMVKYGMRAINQGGRKGLDCLINRISLNKGQIKSDHVAYGIVPHLNAAGRMEDAEIAVTLLSSQEEKVVSDAAEKLVNHNNERKRIQEETYVRYVEMLNAQGGGDLFITIDCHDAHEGIAGIVAGKIKEKYNRPVVIVTPALIGGGAFLKGTGRSIETVNLYTMLKEQEALFEKFGGHAGACGFLMKQENFVRFKSAVNQSMRRMFMENEHLFKRNIEADMPLEGTQVTEGLIREVELLAPFGSQNKKPVFQIEARALLRPVRMGTGNQHVRFTAECQDGVFLSCVFFAKAKEYAGLIESGKPVRIFGSPDSKVWNGNRRIQFIVDEIQKIG